MILEFFNNLEKKHSDILKDGDTFTVDRFENEFAVYGKDLNNEITQRGVDFNANITQKSHEFNENITQKLPPNNTNWRRKEY